MKKLTTLQLILIISSSAGNCCFSQGIGVNSTGASPDNSAIFDVSSNAKGVLLPRMAIAQRDSISIKCSCTLATGLLIYNSDCGNVNVYNGSSWVDMVGNAVTGAPSAPIAGTHAPSQTQIVWNWNAVSNATGYKWNTSNNYGTATATSPAGTASYTQTGLTCNTTDTLYVWAYNNCGTSAVAMLTQNTLGCGPCAGASTMMDSRDGKAYNIVAIGNQCWFAQNLNVGTFLNMSAGGQTNNGIIEKFCQNVNDQNDNTCPYGGLYVFGEAVQYLNGETNTSIWNPVPTGNIQGICPSGWHIPSDAEWCTLENTVEANTDASCSVNNTMSGTNTGGDLKEAGTAHWISNTCNSTCNSTGFTALPGGYGGDDGNLYQAGYYTYFFSSTDGGDGTGAWVRFLYYNSSQIGRGNHTKADARSIRCVKN